MLYNFEANFISPESRSAENGVDSGSEVISSSIVTHFVHITKDIQAKLDV
jgi:hypothetical protein